MSEPGTRRGFIIGALALVTAPAIVRADSLMKIAPIDVYDTRCLIDYDIGSDQLLLRVDRSLRRLVRPHPNRATELDVKTARAIFGDHPIFRVSPVEGLQVYAARPVTNHELQQHGLVWV